MRCALTLMSVSVLAGCDCGYRVRAPEGPDLDAAVPPDASTDGPSLEDSGAGDGLWMLEQAVLELHEPECPFVEGQEAFALVTVIAPNLCHQPGPVDVALDGGQGEIVLAGRYWRPLPGSICADMTAREDRWVSLGWLDEGTWTVRDESGRQHLTLEVGPPSGRACADPQVRPGEACEADCDCAWGTCLPGLDAGGCGRRCGLPCGMDVDCLEGRCASEMPEGERCRPTDGPCRDDTDCQPAQRCRQAQCLWREVEPGVEYRPCASGAECPAGSSCVTEAADRPGVCAMRCFTQRTPCPAGVCSADLGFGPAWTCGLIQD